MAAACFMDYRCGKIPNEIILVMCVAGVTESFLNGGLINVFYFVIKAAAVTVLLYPVFRIGAVGAGDVKLIGVCSGFISRGRILRFLFFSMLIAAMFSIIKMCIKRNFKERFTYLGNYISEILTEGRAKRYFENNEELRVGGVCLSGPVMCSMLMHVAGMW
jgi:Flp pilus assembly protein protease CpaA